MSASKPEKILIKAPRSHKDGHLFEVHGQLVDWLAQYEHFKGVTKSILELLNLISVRGFSSQDGYVSTTELVDATDGQLTRAAIQQRLRAAVQLGLFLQQPVRFEEGLAGKTMLHRFVNPSRLISSLGSAGLMTEKSRDEVKQKRSKALAQTQVNRQLLSEHGLGTPPMMPGEKDQILVSPTSWAGIIDQALAPPRTKKPIKNQWLRSAGPKPLLRHDQPSRS